MTGDEVPGITLESPAHLGGPAADRPGEDLDERVRKYLANPVQHVFGNPDAAVCVVEFGDFECPYCAAAAPILQELVESSQGGVRLIWRNFPLFESHPHALTTALAAESVAATGGEEAFWAFHDKVLKNQSRLNDFDLRLYARHLGADPEYAAGEQAQVFAPIVQADYAAGLEAGVPATPTLYVDGNAFEGRLDLESLRRATGQSLREGLNRARRRPWQRR
jgi:protein-disulfide isomerase